MPYKLLTIKKYENMLSISDFLKTSISEKLELNKFKKMKYTNYWNLKNFVNRGL